MHQEQVVNGQEWGGVHEALGIKEPFEIVVLLVSLYIFLKFVYIKVSLRMPVFVFKILKVRESFFPSELCLEVEPGCLEGPIVYNG